MTASAADDIDDRPVQFRGNSRTPLAATKKTPLSDMFFAYIIGGVHDDGPAKHIIVPAFFLPLQPERIPMLADKRLAGEIKPKAAHQAIAPVGEPAGHQRTRIPPVGDKGIK